MSSKKPIAIAAVLSLLILGGLVGVALLVLNQNSGVDPYAGRDSETTVAEPSAPSESSSGSSDSTEAREVAPPPTKAAKVGLTVRVVEVGSRTPIRSSRILVTKAGDGNQSGELVYSTRAGRGARGNNGTFQVELVPGTYFVKAQALDFQPKSERVQLVENKPVNIEMALDRGLSISGVVYDSDRKPIGGALVRAFKKIGEPDSDLISRLIDLTNIKEMSRETPAEAVSEADGTYQISGLEKMYYDVVAVASHHAPATKGWVRPSQRNVDFVLPEGSQFSGFVLSQGGTPIEGATVKVYPEIDSTDIVLVVETKARPPLVEVQTGSNGAFEILSLGQGIYNVKVSAPGYQETDFPKEIINAGENPPKNYVLEEGLVIAGTVVDEEGQPVVGAKVRPTRIGNPQQRNTPINVSFGDDSASTDENGEFIFDTLSSAKYNLLVKHEDFASTQVNSVAVGSTSLRVTLDRGAGIAGRVVEAETGEPIPGASVVVRDLMDVTKEGITDAEGYYSVTGLNSRRGKRYASVRADGFSRLSNETVPVREGEVTEDVNFQLERVAVVTGRVVDGAGRPVAGARVMARRPQGNTSYPVPVGSDETDADGQYTIELEAGPGTVLAASGAKFLEARLEPLTVAPGERLNAPDIVLSLGGFIKGVAVDADGRPVQGVHVTVREEGDTEFSHAKTANSDGRGRFTLNGLSAGSIDVKGSHKHYLDAVALDVQVQEGLVNTDVKLVLERGNRLSGLVTDTAGNAVQGATVIVREFADGVKEHRQQTNAEGAYSFASLVSDEPVEVQVTHSNYATYSQKNVDVSQKRHDVQLEKLGGVAGIVLGPDGSGLKAFTVQPNYAGNSTLHAPSPSQTAPRTFTASDGQFRYQGIPAGVYDVSVSAPGHAALSVPGVNVSTGEVVNLGELTLQEGGIIDGVVVDVDSGQPLSGASVRLLGVGRSASADARSSRTSNSTTTDSRGFFLFRGVKDAGNLSLKVEHEGYVRNIVSKIDTRDASTCRDLRIGLELGGEIFGRVIDINGQLKPGLSVYLGGLDSLRGKTGVNQTTRTDGEGRFHFDGLRSGGYRVTARNPGRPNNAGLDVNVAAGRALEVELVVE